MPPAARLTDMHTCSILGTAPHVGGPILGPGALSVLIGGIPAARVGDECMCMGPLDTITTGSTTVFICNMPAARKGDLTAHGGVVIGGLASVLIGKAVAASHGATEGTVGAAPLPSADAQPKPEDVSEFGQRFETITGMKLSESIAQYKADTGNDLSPETVEVLFTDPEAANTILMNDESLHTNYRDILNSNAPSTETAAIEAGYTEMSTFGSYYHNPWYNPWRNSKYISADGHRESVFDGDGNLVDSTEHKGTFNFFGPDQFWNHRKVDVDPYQKWGN